MIFVTHCIKQIVKLSSLGKQAFNSRIRTYGICKRPVISYSAATGAGGRAAEQVAGMWRQLNLRNAAG